MSRTHAVLLSVIAAVVVFGALKVTQPVSLPLAFGVVLLLFFRPLQRRLDRRLPRWVGVVLVPLVCLAFLAFLGGILYFAATTIAPEVPTYVEQVRERLTSLQDRLEERGISLSVPGASGAGGAEGTQGGGDSGGGGPGAGGAAGGAATVARHLMTGMGLISLTLAVLVFLLVEVDAFRKKMTGPAGGPTGDRFVEAFDRMAGKFERYLLVQGFTALLTGILTWAWCAVLGVEFAFVWGALAFALNFVPTVGSVLAVVPPTLFGFAFAGIGIGFAVLGGLALIEFFLGNVVDPALQGEAVDLSPVVVLVSVVFWGWLWGVGGAIIAVPMTIAMVLVFEEFEETRPLATFLSRRIEPKGSPGHA